MLKKVTAERDERRASDGVVACARVVFSLLLRKTKYYIHFPNLCDYQTDGSVLKPLLQEFRDWFSLFSLEKRGSTSAEHPSGIDRSRALACARRSARGAKRDVERGGRPPSVRRGGGDGAAAGADGGGASARGRARARRGGGQSKEPLAVPPPVRRGRVRVVPRAHRDRVHGHGRRRAGAERHRRARGAGAGQHELDPEPGGPGGPAPRRAPRRGEDGNRAAQRGGAPAPAGGPPARRARGGGAEDRDAAPARAARSRAQNATGGGAGGALRDPRRDFFSRRGSRVGWYRVGRYRAGWYRRENRRRGREGQRRPEKAREGRRRHVPCGCARRDEPRARGRRAVRPAPAPRAEPRRRVQMRRGDVRRGAARRAVRREKRERFFARAFESGHPRVATTDELDPEHGAHAERASGRHQRVPPGRARGFRGRGEGSAVRSSSRRRFDGGEVRCRLGRVHKRRGLWFGVRLRVSARAQVRWDVHR